MDIEQERKAFEAWVKQTFGVPAMPDRFDRQDYDAIEDKKMWRAWQARAKQAGTLPVKDATGEH